MRKYEMFELTIDGAEIRDAWAQTDVKAVFTCGELKKEVKGFYDGNGKYVVRFLPESEGVWHYTVSGAVRAEGEAVCGASVLHGPVHAVDTHFVYADGTAYIPFGTTVYALASQEDELVHETLKSLRTSPFNKIRMCVFPKDYDFNHNEPPLYAFEKKQDGTWDVNRPDFAFWHRFEKILSEIMDMGIQVDLILFHPYDRWGFASLEQKENLVYLDYLLRRLSAMPGLWWSLANEYDLCLEHKTLEQWKEIEDFVSENDPYHHLLSCHNCFCFWDFSRPHVTHASIQTKALTEIPRWLRTWNKPVMIDECCYEGNIMHFWGSISGREMTRRFWRCYASGAYCTHGETFLDEKDILWWSRGGRLKGESPERIAFLRSIMEQLPGPLTPISEGFSAYADLPQEEIRALAEQAEGTRKSFILSMAMMDPLERHMHMAAEHTYAACFEDKAYLWYFDLQCYGKKSLKLPDRHSYRVECIDTWNMTRQTICEKASGTTDVQLPSKDGMALLAVMI